MSEHSESDAYRVADELNWRCVKAKGGGYDKLLCPCPKKHKRWVHKTPSDPNYFKNLIAYLRRACRDD